MSIPHVSLGIDHYQKGWCAVSLRADDFGVGFFPDLSAALSFCPDAMTAWIDMPMGLPSDADLIRPESQVRKILGRRSSTLFSVPCRQALGAFSYGEACRINQEVLGKKLSKQSFALFPGIREVDQWCRDHKPESFKLHESHPEICFGIINGIKWGPGQIVPLEDSKHSFHGKQSRIRLLEQAHPLLGRLLSQTLRNGQEQIYQVDVLDACSLALLGLWSLQNGLQSFPESPHHDAVGLPMSICYAWPPDSNERSFCTDFLKEGRNA